MGITARDARIKASKRFGRGMLCTVEEVLTVMHRNDCHRSQLIFNHNWQSGCDKEYDKRVKQVAQAYIGIIPSALLPRDWYELVFGW